MMDLINYSEIVDVIKLIPDEEQSYYIEWGQRRTKDCWDIGRRVNKLIDDILNSGIKIGKMEIYNAVGRLAGISGRTVRYYSDIVAFYSDGNDQEIYEILPFSHFAFARQFGNGAYDILETSINYMDEHGGRLPSVEWLEHEFLEQPQIKIEQPVNETKEILSTDDNIMTITANDLLDNIKHAMTYIIDTLLNNLKDPKTDENIIKEIKMHFDCILKLLNSLTDDPN